MKKAIIVCLAIAFLLSGCSKVRYSKEFAGIPIYQGTALFPGNDQENKVIEMYADLSFKGDIEEVKRFFDKNIDHSIWTIDENNQTIIGHTADKLYEYALKSKKRDASLIISYSKSEEAMGHLSITIIGNKLK
jgi:hypothetical protein